MGDAGRKRLAEACLNVGRAMFELAAALERLNESENIPTMEEMEDEVRGITQEDTPWTEPALSLLDSMWSLNVYVGTMQRRLCPMLGWNPTPEQIRSMACRYRDAPTPSPRQIPPACRPIDGIAARLPRRPNPPERTTHFPVPPGGFSMLGGRMR